MVHQEQISFETAGHRHMADVTDQVAAIVGRSGVKTGIAQVFCVGSTAAVGAIEFEPGLQRDLPETLDRLIPPSRAYGHEQAWHDGNGHSHLQATLLGPSLSVPVADGKPVLGTWQQIIHLECDVRPRRRTVVVTVMTLGRSRSRAPVRLIRCRSRVSARATRTARVMLQRSAKPCDAKSALLSVRSCARRACALPQRGTTKVQ